MCRFGLTEAQGAGESIERGIGWTDRPSLFEADILVDADAR